MSSSWIKDPHKPNAKRVLMANHVSSLKRARQTIGKTATNRANKSKLRGTLRTLREAIAKGDQGELMKVYASTASLPRRGLPEALRQAHIESGNLRARSGGKTVRR